MNRISGFGRLEKSLTFHMVSGHMDSRTCLSSASNPQPTAGGLSIPPDLGGFV